MGVEGGGFMPTNVRYWKHMKILRFVADRTDEPRRTTTRHISSMCRQDNIYARRSAMNGALNKLLGMGVVRFTYEHDFDPFYEVDGAPAMPHHGDIRVWVITDSGRRLLEKVDRDGVRDHHRWRETHVEAASR